MTPPTTFLFLVKLYKGMFVVALNFFAVYFLFNLILGPIIWPMVSLSQLTRCSLVQKQNLHKLRMTFDQMIRTNNHIDTQTFLFSVKLYSETFARTTFVQMIGTNNHIDTQTSLFSVKLYKETFAPLFLRL